MAEWKHATDDEAEAIRDYVADLLGEWVPRAVIVRDVASRFGIGERQARNYVAQVRAEWTRAQVRTADVQETRARLNRSLELVLRRAHASHDLRAVVAAAAELAELNGLHQPTPTDSEKERPATAMARVLSVKERLRRRALT